jgi:hypothetical protein
VTARAGIETGFRKALLTANLILLGRLLERISPMNVAVKSAAQVPAFPGWDDLDPKEQAGR